ncbi:glyoxylate/hydroxypyruvate reductase A [Flavobacteriaceae bacterium TP-CH-4]|uniref:Glyoxylate/hydroxypyruvate reductase A n=1 Tax=Pelagihabitans pacificus TaxID=2696054 RepID=A0A967ATX2_9FLAO|nr:glyoxylate/hydroxypyruvate reductase A [Pelagihabitans pacificus]NHF59857.1 glyoxylate/hydroxypyruvate reductase A [Pelagihabitans pacificus]
MSIVILRQDDKIDLWKHALRSAAPDIPVYSGDEDHPKDRIDMALVWKHRPGSLSEYPNLKCIASSGAGVDFIFEDASAPTHLPITRVVNPMLASDMSEHVIALIFAYLKNLNHYKIDQQHKIWKPLNYKRIKDFTVGILGLGALGAVLANDLVRVGFKVQGWSRSKKTMKNIKTFFGNEDLADFLATTGILVCLLPLTQATAGILNSELFQKLPKGAYLINVARGGHLVNRDLLEALKNEHLSGAALDVFHEEPLPVAHPFWEHPKIHMSPHCASVSDTDSVVPQIVENHQRLLAGKPLNNLVHIERGY